MTTEDEKMEVVDPYNIAVVCRDVLRTFASELEPDPQTIDEPLVVALRNVCRNLRVVTNRISSSPASYVHAWSVHLLRVSKVAAGLHALLAIVCGGGDGSGGGGGGENGGNDDAASIRDISSPRGERMLSAAAAAALSAIARARAVELEDLLEGPLSPPLFVPASAACEAAWQESQRSAGALAGSLLLLLARLTAARGDAAAAAALREASLAWDALEVAVVRDAPVSMTAHLEAAVQGFHAGIGDDPVRDVAPEAAAAAAVPPRPVKRKLLPDFAPPPAGPASPPTPKPAVPVHEEQPGAAAAGAPSSGSAASEPAHND